MSEFRTCPVCGHSAHIENMWPECPCCIAEISNAAKAHINEWFGKPFTIFDYKAFPVPIKYMQRAARLWCKPLTQDYEMQPAIAHVVAKLIYHLERAETELRTVNSNAGTRAEIAAPITLILNELL